MTKEEFLVLSTQKQEDFINSGEVFTPSTNLAPTSKSVALQVESLNTEASSFPPVDTSEGFGCSFLSTQPASSISSDSARTGPGSQPTTPTTPIEVSPITMGATAINDKGFFDGIMIENPIQLLMLCDDDIRSGRVTLYPWQLQFMLDFAEAAYNGDHNFPFQAIVRAANGSGKDKYIIAPCIVWLCTRFRKTIGVVTSASGAQLDNMTCRYIQDVCLKLNSKLGIVLWETINREYTLNFGKDENGQELGNSKIYAYCTDEPKKAEGYHPMEHGAKMVIMVSEDKSVPDDINVAINKCTGYTHRVHVSTPGAMIGHFYDYSRIAINRDLIDNIKEVKPTDWIEYHIPATKCLNHLSVNYIAQMKRDLVGGENGAAYKSQVMAEFCAVGEMVVIPYTYIWRAVHKPRCTWNAESFNTAGLDLSDGGDETVLSIRNGNKLLKVIPFRFEDSEDTITFLDNAFRENNLNNPQSRIFGDCGGLGSPMLKRLRKMGWTNIRFVDNRAKPSKPLVYKNRGSEVFFHMRDLLEHNELILVEDDLTMKQLGGRYYKLVDGRIHQLLSKIEQKSKGYRSPDRADSVNLAFWNFESTFQEVPDDHVIPFTEQEVEEKVPVPIDMRVGTKQSYENFISKKTGGKKDLSFLFDEINEHNARRIQLNNK